MNFAAHRVYQAGLLDYLLLSAQKTGSPPGSQAGAVPGVEPGPAAREPDDGGGDDHA